MTIDQIQLVAVLIMPLGMLLLFFERLKSGRGLGARAIQLTSIFFVIPIIFILSLQKLISSEATSTLLGTVIGYVLSGIGKFRSENVNIKPEEKK